MANFELFSETQIYPGTTNGPIVWESEYAAIPWPIFGDGNTTFPTGIQIRDALLRGLRSGSTLRAIQDIEIEIDILDNSKLDSDKRYVTPKNYCGNFQPIENGSILINHTGFLFSGSERQTIRNAFDISVISDKHANEFLSFRQQFSGQLISCNWQEWQLGFTSVPIPNLGTIEVEVTQLKEGQYGSPNLLFQSETQQKWNSDANNYPYDFIGGYSTALQPPLEYWKKLHLYLYDSVNLVSIRNSVSLQVLAIDFVPSPITDYLPAPTCSREIENNCDSYFESLLQGPNQQYFNTQAECLAANGNTNVCFQIDVFCPSDSNQSRLLWIDQNLDGGGD